MATATRPHDRTERRRVVRRLRLPVGMVLALALLGLTGCNLRPGFHDYVVFDGLTRPTSVEFSSDGRIFVTEKRGVLKVFDGLDDTTATVAADLRTNTYNSWDRGMLGLALHPAFPAVPDVFVAYTHDALPGGTAPRWGRPGVDNDTCPTPPGETDDGCVVGARISRLRLAGSVWDGVEHVLVEDWCQQFPSHTIGTLAFGADGALYAGAGDGANFDFADHGQRGNPCGDPVGEGGALRSQDLRTAGDPLGLSGTIIRVDPATGQGLPTNPLAGSPDANARRIVASGLRNPFRFAIRPGTNDVWLADVGWRTWEEINRTRGDDATLDNFGWPCHEGSGRTRDYDVLDLPVCEDLYAQGGTVGPVFTYGHGEVLDDERCPTGDGSSISGLAFAPPDTPYPAEYRRALFFADATRGCIWAMGVGAHGLPDPTQITWFDQGARTPVELEFGPGGELWYVDLFGGRIHRLGYSATNQAPQAAVVRHSLVRRRPPDGLPGRGRVDRRRPRRRPHLRLGHRRRRRARRWDGAHGHRHVRVARDAHRAGARDGRRGRHRHRDRARPGGHRAAGTGDRRAGGGRNRAGRRRRRVLGRRHGPRRGRTARVRPHLGRRPVALHDPAAVPPSSRRVHGRRCGRGLVHDARPRVPRGGRAAAVGHVGRRDVDRGAAHRLHDGRGHARRTLRGRARPGGDGGPAAAHRDAPGRLHGHGLGPILGAHVLGHPRPRLVVGRRGAHPRDRRRSG